MAVGALPRTGLSENARAAGYMVLASLGFSVNDAFMKTLAGEVPLLQAVFLRGLMASTLIGLLAWRSGALRYRPGRRDRRLIGLRSLSEIGGTVCFLLALFNMPIAGATAILQSLPLAVTLAAAVFFGEPVGWRRYLAIGIGFLGVLIIVRPGSDHFNAYALWALAAIGFIVARDLSTRRMSPGTPGMAVVFVTAGVLTLAAGLAALATDWEPVRSATSPCSRWRRSACSSGTWRPSSRCGPARSASSSPSATRCCSGPCSSAS